MVRCLNPEDGSFGWFPPGLVRSLSEITDRRRTQPADTEFYARSQQPLHLGNSRIFSLALGVCGRGCCHWGHSGGNCCRRLRHRPEPTSRARLGLQPGTGTRPLADLNPEFAACKLGHEQSPVDISNPKPADLPPIQFDYKPSPLRIIDNGHTLMIKYASGSSISMMERTYALQQFHFHKPSESKIDGKAYDMELHLVHADEKGELVVVAVLMRQGPDNGTMHKVLDHVPGEKEKEESPQGIEVDASALLPADKSYYVFMGSLTTPPCTEHVTWLVLKQPITVSAAQIEQFSKLYPNNARPTQPLYDRVVHASK